MAEMTVRLTAATDEQIRAYLDRHPDAFAQFLRREVRRDPHGFAAFMRQQARVHGYGWWQSGMR